MYSFNHTIPYVPPASFTHTVKDQVWAYLIAENGSAIAVWKKYNVPLEDCELMLKELEQFEQEVISKVRGTWEFSPAVLDAEGNITTPAVYYQHTGRVDLLKTIFPNYVPKDLAMDELIRCYPTYNAARTYNQFVIAVRS